MIVRVGNFELPNYYSSATIINVAVRLQEDSGGGGFRGRVWRATTTTGFVNLISEVGNSRVWRATTTTGFVNVINSCRIMRRAECTGPQGIEVDGVGKGGLGGYGWVVGDGNQPSPEIIN
ncbi:hypothetical protein QE152_g21879 [Popillia japonica]|uniref:Uncharacterized protein n=1 Tax=Popillia japonica TaxID=7064 RepID=A0AAW1KKP6_POPJA